MRRNIEFPPFRKLSFGRALLPLPQPRCSLQSERCVFKAPARRSTAHSHICPLSAWPVPSGDIYSSLGDTLLSAAEENGAAGEGAAGESTNPAVFQEDESLPRTSSGMLYLLPLR